MGNEIFKVGDKVKLISWETAIKRSQEQEGFTYKFNPINNSIFAIRKSSYEREKNKGIRVIKKVGRNIFLKESGLAWPPFCLEKIKE